METKFIQKPIMVKDANGSYFMNENNYVKMKKNSKGEWEEIEQDCAKNDFRCVFEGIFWVGVTFVAILLVIKILSL